MKRKRIKRKHTKRRHINRGRIFAWVIVALAAFLLFRFLKMELNGTGGGTNVLPGNGQGDIYQPDGGGKLIDVPVLADQSGLYPTGCESASSVMLLQYWGVKMGMEEFINRCLPRQELVMEGGLLTGPDPNEAFIGDPREASGYGCYAPVIVTALERAVGRTMEVINETGASLEELVEQYVDNNIPVLIWATMDLKPVKAGTSWYVPSTGEMFTWKSGEHCMVLAGYDQEYYYFNDPYQDRGVVKYKKKLVQARYQEMGKQAVVVT